jgi:hypothetical protein
MASAVPSLRIQAVAVVFWPFTTVTRLILYVVALAYTRVKDSVRLDCCGVDVELKLSFIAENVLISGTTLKATVLLAEVEVELQLVEVVDPKTVELLEVVDVLLVLLVADAELLVLLVDTPEEEGDKDLLEELDEPAGVEDVEEPDVDDDEPPVDSKK